jgi:iron(III) transport system ATP-binding protein
MENTSSDANKTVLALQNVSFAYPGGRSICRDLDLTVKQGEIACLLGPSGCGKTTVLRLVAGFERPSGGDVVLADTVVASANKFVAPEARGVGYVFQDFALFPHLNVAKNIAFGLRHMKETEVAVRVNETLALVGLSRFAARYPHELSGGQRQRVALARALAPRPKLLLMDEPFSSLDVELREKLSLEVRTLLKRLNTTALFVTHDQHEAFAIADRISVMHHGVIEQTDLAYNLYHRPMTRFVADFVGQGVLIQGHGVAGGTITTEIGIMHPTNLNASDVVPGERYDVLLRPDDIQHDDASTATAEVTHKAFRGADILYTLKLAGGTEVLSLVPSHHNHELGQKIGIRLEIDHVVAFQANEASEAMMAAD